MWSLITFLVVGFLAGLLARALVSGPGPKGVVATTVLGVVGSFVGGFIGYLIFDRDEGLGAVRAAGFLGSLVGAVLVLLGYRRILERR